MVAEREKLFWVCVYITPNAWFYARLGSTFGSAASQDQQSSSRRCSASHPLAAAMFCSMTSHGATRHCHRVASPYKLVRRELHQTPASPVTLNRGCGQGRASCEASPCRNLIGRGSSVERVAGAHASVVRAQVSCVRIRSSWIAIGRRLPCLT